jgi:hypothetical protein
MRSGGATIVGAAKGHTPTKKPSDSIEFRDGAGNVRRVDTLSELRGRGRRVREVHRMGPV